MGFPHPLATRRRARVRLGARAMRAAVALTASLPLACGVGAGGPATLDDHDHRSALAAVEAMDGHRETPAGRRAASDHLRALPAAPATGADSARADLLLLEMRDALRRYEDTTLAAADGFAPLSAAGPVAPAEPADADALVHLVNWKWALAEEFRFNPARPTALVYRRRHDGRRALVGALYTAPDGATEAQLDRRVPVRVGRWHQHVDWCTPKRGDDARWTETAPDGTPVFGPASRIATRASCDSVAGTFHARIFGWMLHANLFASDEPDAVWRDPVASVDDRTAAPSIAADSAVPTPATADATPAPAPGVPSTVTSAATPAVRPASTRPATLVNAPVTTPTPATAPLATPKPQPVAPTPAPPQSPSTVFARGAPLRVLARARLGAGGAVTAPAVAVPYTRFAAGTPGAHHPAVLMLQGVDAPTDTAAFRLSAAALARSGYVVAVLRYDSAAASAGQGGVGGAHEEWQRRVSAGLAALAADPQVDSTRIGLLGIRTGARVALIHASRDRRVKCVVDYFAGTPRDGGLIQRMPPVAIIAAEATPGEVTEATELRNLLSVLHVPTDVHVYAMRAGQMAPSDRVDATRAVAAFLAKYLRPGDTTP